MSRTAIIIPARYGSSRFPGKPLASIAGVMMIERVWRIAMAANADAVHVATDDKRIADAVSGFGGSALMTPASCRNGTERSLAALDLLGPAETPDVVVNLQGDAVLTPPWVIADVIAAMRDDPDLAIATPAVAMTAAQFETFRSSKADGTVGGTTVTFDHQGNALYFSKSIIPFVRSDSATPAVPAYRHIGLYAYRTPVLRRLSALAPGPFEAAEQLEQLRALENGIPIRVVQVGYRGRSHWSVDSPADVAVAERLIAAEGELVLPTTGPPASAGV